MSLCRKYIPPVSLWGYLHMQGDWVRGDYDNDRVDFSLILFNVAMLSNSEKIKETE